MSPGVTIISPSSFFMLITLLFGFLYALANPNIFFLCCFRSSVSSLSNSSPHLCFAIRFSVFTLFLASTYSNLVSKFLCLSHFLNFWDFSHTHFLRSSFHHGECFFFPPPAHFDPRVLSPISLTIDVSSGNSIWFSIPG